MFLSSLIAASLLLMTYIGLAMVSARHGCTLHVSCQPEQMLSTIAVKLLGPTGGFLAAVAIIMACLTTAMTLVSIFADYLRKDLFQNRMHPILACILTLGVAAFFASLGFGGIAAILGPVLQVIYPGLILLTLWNFIQCCGKKGVA